MLTFQVCIARRLLLPIDKLNYRLKQPGPRSAAEILDGNGHICGEAEQLASVSITFAKA
jgi:hypothetical protein